MPKAELSVKDTKFSVRDITYTAMFAVIIAVSSWITVPTAVPFTLQTFGVAAAVVMLGGKRGIFAVLTYLILGAAGVPVFAGFSGGIGAIIGPTGGYLTGFLIMALIYAAITSKFGTSLPVTAVALAAGLAALYFFGTLQFVLVYSKNNESMGFASAFGICVLPFIIPDIIKVALAVFLSRRAGKYVRIS